MIYYPLSHADAGRHPRHPDHHHAAGHAALRAAARRRLAVGHRTSRYAVQPSPDGLAQAFIIGARLRRRRARARWSWATTSSTATTSQTLLAQAVGTHDGRHGLRLSRARPRALRRGRVRRRGAARVSIEEKPAEPKSQLRRDRALFLRQPGASISRAALKPSPRGELEITDVNRATSSAAQLDVEIMGRGYRLARHRHARQSLLEAGAVHRHARAAPGPEDRLPGGNRLAQGLYSAAQLEALARPLAKNGYGQYLMRLLTDSSLLDA